MRFLILLVVLLFPLFVFGQEEMIPVVIDGDEVSYLQSEGKIVAKGDVRLKNKDVELFCQEANYDASKNIANIIGDVKIIRANTVLYGKDVVYDFNTSDVKMGQIRMFDPPIYGVSKEGSKIGEEKYELKKGYITTCDLENPHYRLVSKKVTIYPGKKVVARNVVLKIGKLPVFYIPYMSQSLKDDSFPFEVVPGKNSEWGYYVLARWRYNLNEENRGKIHFDWYEERGQGYGITHKIESKKFGSALINYYRIKDDLYSLQNRKYLFDQFPQRESKAPKYLEDDRYKAQFSYGWDPNPDLSIRSEFHKFSDEYFMKDFFEREYDIEPHPLSYTLITYSLDHSSLSLLAQKRFNRFWTETEYLPQLEYDFYEQNLGDSKFYFESLNKVGNLNYETANSGNNEASLRAYSHNRLSYVDKLKWLHIKPYVGAYSVFYSRTQWGEEDSPRIAPEAGITLSANLYKIFELDWPWPKEEEIKLMRHVMTPELEYTYMHDSTIPDNNIYQFDTYDNLEREESIVFTLKNKLQARNDKKTWDFLYFSPSVEYKIHREGHGSYFDNITADLEVYPWEGFSWTSDAKYDCVIRAFSEINTDLTFSKKTKSLIDGKETEQDKYTISLGHRYLRKDSSQGTLGFTYQLTPKLQYRQLIRYEYSTEDFENQQYSIRADLHCWWLDLGLDIDRHDRGGKDLTFWVAFTLKDFPDISVEFDHDYKGAKPAYQN